jgi:hypothetical protein
MPYKRNVATKQRSEVRRHHLNIYLQQSNVVKHGTTTPLSFPILMKQKKGMLFFGLTEITIGTFTLIATAISFFYHISTKPLNILIFVIASSIISISLGLGIILRYHYARKLLMFFAGWIILSKFLVSTNIISISGALETTLPLSLKNIISILYHLVIILYFHHPSVKKEYAE